jgi:hypothetical protein
LTARARAQYQGEAKSAEPADRRDNPVAPILATVRYGWNDPILLQAMIQSVPQGVKMELPRRIFAEGLASALAAHLAGTRVGSSPLNFTLGARDRNVATFQSGSSPEPGIEMLVHFDSCSAMTHRLTMCVQRYAPMIPSLLLLLVGRPAAAVGALSLQPFAQSIRVARMSRI